MGDSVDLAECQIEASVYAVCDADWKHLPRVPSPLQIKLIRQLRANGGGHVTEETISMLEAVMEQPRPEHQEVVIVARSTVFDDVGGHLSGPVGRRVAAAFGETNGAFIQVEACHRCSDDVVVDLLGRVEVASRCKPGTAEWIPRDDQGRPIVVIQKAEEQLSTAYQDVTFSWPKQGASESPTKRQK